MKNTIDTYISELLFLHDCVIIPNLGGFVGNNKSAIINESSGTIYPPSKEILFNKNLTTNDGLLISHIAIKESISSNKAKELAEEYVKNINEKLKKIRTFRIEKVGLLSVGIDGNILFLQDSFTNYNLNSFGLKSEKTKKVDKIEKQIDAIIQPITTKTGRRKVWRAAAILLPIIGLSLISITQEDKINNIYSQMANLNPFYIFESEPTTKEIDTKTIELEPIEIIKEVIETPIIVIEDKIIEKNFHLIAGAFSKEKNAEKFVLKLQNDNYNSSIVGKTKGGLIRVCFDSFATKEEATTALNILKSDNKSAWILSL
ncbi:MAG: HU domain-containing protein [Flavobacteriales bacterium]